MALPSEQVLWEGRPTWKAWASDWILGWALLPILVGAFLLLRVVMQTRLSRYKVTTLRIETETGLLSKRVDNLELWRVQDVEYSQSLLDPLLKISRLQIRSQDKTSPVLEVRGLPADRTVYDQLMSAVMQSRQQRGVMNVVS